MNSEIKTKKSQIVIDSVAYFIILSSALCIVSGILFPTSIATSNTTMILTNKPISYWLTDKVDKNLVSNPVDVAGKEDSERTERKESLQLEKKEQEKNDRFGFWSFFASDDDDTQDTLDLQIKQLIPSKEKVVSPIIEVSESSQILLEPQIEKKIKNVWSQIFIDDVESKVKNEEYPSNLEYDEESKKIKEKSADDSIIYSWLTSNFMADTSELEDKKSSNLDKNEKKQDQAFNYQGFFVSDEIDDDVQLKDDPFFAPNPKVTSSAMKSENLEILEKEKDSIIADPIEERDDSISLTSLLKFYESLLKIQKAKPAAVSHALLSNVQSQIIKLLPDDQDEHETVQDSKEPPNYLSDNALEVEKDLMQESLEKLKETNPGLEKSLPLYISFLKNQFTGKGEKGLGGWNTILVDDLNDDSPLDEILVKGPSEKMAQEKIVKSPETEANSNSVLAKDADADADANADGFMNDVLAKQKQVHQKAKTQQKKDNPAAIHKAQRKIEKQFDWDNVLAEDANADANADGFMNDVLAKQKQVHQKAKTQQKKDNPAGIHKAQRKNEKQFDWDNVLAEDANAGSPMEKLLVEATENRDKNTVIQKVNLQVKNTDAKVLNKDTKKKPKLSLNIFAFGNDEDEELILAPTPKSTNPKKIRGFDWNIAPKIFKVKNAEEKKKEFIAAKQDMEKNVKDTVESVKRFGLSWNLAPKIYKSSPESAAKNKLEYERAKGKVVKTIKTIAAQIFYLF